MDDRDLDNEYYLRRDYTEKAYGDLMNAVDEAFEISRRRKADENELKELREERKEYKKKIDDLNFIIADNNKKFMEIFARETAKIAQERDEAKRLHAEMVAERDMWKKSYEDLMKCV